MMKWQSIKVSTVAIPLLVLLFSSCHQNPGDSDTGELIVRITDAPFPVDMVDYANVTINKVEIRSATADTGNPFITLTDDNFSKTFDILQLQNGVTGDVVQMEIPNGSYDLVRLYVDSAQIKVTDGDVYSMKVPSGAQTGIKIFINQPIEVAGVLSAELLLDFDINKSFKVQGNPGTPAGIHGFNFTPVIRAINRSEAGRISGYVKEDNSEMPVENATVFTEIAPMDTMFTKTDADGFYALVGLDPGTYDVTAGEASHDTVSVEDVVVVVGNNTMQDFTLTAKP